MREGGRAAEQALNVVVCNAYARTQEPIQAMLIGYEIIQAADHINRIRQIQLGQEFEVRLRGPEIEGAQLQVHRPLGIVEAETALRLDQAAAQGEIVEFLRQFRRESDFVETGRLGGDRADRAVGI